MHKKLEHLSPKQFDELIRRYDEGEKVNKLIDEFEIDVHTNGLVKLLPLLVNEESFCPYCQDTKFVSKRIARSNNLSTKSRSCRQILTKKPIWFCDRCGHYKDNTLCQCKKCLDVRKQKIIIEEQNRRKIIEKTFTTRDVNHPDPNQLSLLNALLLLSLERYSSPTNLHMIQPFLRNPKFSPTEFLTSELINYMYVEKFINISSDTPTSAFKFDQNHNIEGIIATNLIWEFLPGKSIERKKRYIIALNNLVTTREFPESWIDEIPIIWKKIATHECIEYLTYKLKKIDINTQNIYEKTYIIFDRLLKELSIGQILCLTYNVINCISHQILSDNAYIKNINIDYITGAIKRKAQRYQSKNYQVTHFKRDSGYPQSVIRFTFFNIILDIGDEYLRMTPTNIYPPHN